RSHGGLDARLRRQVGDPPEPDPGRQRRLRADGTGDRARAAHVRGLRGGLPGRRRRGGHGGYPGGRRLGAHLRSRPGARPAHRPGLMRSRPMQERYEHFIGGAFVPPRAGRYLETWNPATGKRLGEIARGDGADVDAAVAAAWSAWPGWRDRRPIERGRVLLEIARRLRERQQEIATLEILETGKPAWQAPFEVEVAAQYFEFYGGLVNAQPRVRRRGPRARRAGVAPGLRHERGPGVQRRDAAAPRAGDPRRLRAGPERSREERAARPDAGADAHRGAVPEGAGVLRDRPGGGRDDRRRRLGRCRPAAR